MFHSINFDNQTAPFSFTEKVIQSKFYTTYLGSPGELTEPEKSRSWKKWPFRPQVIARIAFTALILSPIIAPAGALWNWAQYRLVVANDSEKAKQFSKAAFEDLKTAGSFIVLAAESTLIYGAANYFQSAPHKIVVLIGAIFSLASFIKTLPEPKRAKDSSTQTENPARKEFAVQTEFDRTDSATQTKNPALKEFAVQTELHRTDSSTQTENPALREFAVQTEFDRTDSAAKTNEPSKGNAKTQTQGPSNVKTAPVNEAAGANAKQEILNLYLKAQKELTDIVFQQVNIITICELPFNGNQIAAKLESGSQKTTEIIQKLQQKQKDVEHHRNQYLKMGGKSEDLNLDIYSLLPKYRDTYAENIALAEFDLVRIIRALNEQIAKWKTEGVICVTLPYDFPLNSKAILERITTISRNYGAETKRRSADLAGTRQKLSL